jgi:hypothetical protein
MPNTMNIALLTSTIAPDPGVFLLKRASASERLKDYKEAFAFYCDELNKASFDRIIYADNSGHPLDELAVIAANKGVGHLVEFISYKSTVSPQNSRFYLEINLIEQVVNHSTILRMHADCTVWKITGRYIVKNVARIISACIRGRRADVYVNFRDFPRPVLDFYLIGFTLTAYRALFDGNIQLYEGTADGEAILRKFIDGRQLDGIVLRRRLPVTPRVLGVRGYDGGKYGGAKDTTKYLLRGFANAVLPWLWI